MYKPCSNVSQFTIIYRLVSIGFLNLTLLAVHYSFKVHHCHSKKSLNDLLSCVRHCTLLKHGWVANNIEACASWGGQWVLCWNFPDKLKQWLSDNVSLFLDPKRVCNSTIYQGQITVISGVRRNDLICLRTTLLSKSIDPLWTLWKSLQVIACHMNYYLLLSIGPLDRKIDELWIKAKSFSVSKDVYLKLNPLLWVFWNCQSGLSRALN